MIEKLEKLTTVPKEITSGNATWLYLDASKWVFWELRSELLALVRECKDAEAGLAIECFDGITSALDALESKLKELP